MLDTPKYGWSNITIGGWSDRCSYLDDVPYKLFYALDAVVRRQGPQAVKFDAEGWEYIIVFDWYETHIISYKDNDVFSLTSIDIDIRYIVEEFVADIRSNLDGWANWLCDASEDEVDMRKIDLEVLCGILEKRIG